MRYTFVVFIVLSIASGARAVEIQRSGPEEFPSKHELSAHLGGQAGFGGKLGTPSGFKLNGEYAYRFHEILWFDLQLSQLFGFGAECQFPALPAYCYRGGWAVELAGGVKIKLKTRIPLVVEIPILVGLDGIYNRACGDNGVAVPVVRAGGGVKYFLTQRIGVGLQTNFAFGPAFLGSGTNTSPCQTNSYVDFYGAWDFLIGAEFLL
jgi:hypothetical protein